MSLAQRVALSRGWAVAASSPGFCRFPRLGPAAIIGREASSSSRAPLPPSDAPLPPNPPTPGQPPAAPPFRGFSAGASSTGWLDRAPGLRAATGALRDARERAAAASARLRETRSALYARLPASVRHVLDTQGDDRRRVIALHFDAFWHSYGSAVTVAGGVAGTLLLWKTMLGVGGVFCDVSGSSSTLLGTSALVVGGSLAAARQRNTIAPDAVYRSVMRQLNSHLGVLEAMGAPLVGTERRAYVLSGGGLRLQGLTPAFRSHRMQMVFLLRGADARGIVAVDVRKWKGRSEFKLLALDIPSADGNNVRIYLHGQPSQFEEGGVFDQLYAPLKTATGMQAIFDADDKLDKQREVIARDALNPKPLHQGGGMYVWERAVEAFHSLRRRVMPAR
eukprot:jgi/Tetstr1/421300/TSEL_012273.t1